jgi:hypothetical protein
MRCACRCEPKKESAKREFQTFGASKNTPMLRILSASLSGLGVAGPWQNPGDARSVGNPSRSKLLHRLSARSSSRHSPVQRSVLPEMLPTTMARVSCRCTHKTQHVELKFEIVVPRGGFEPPTRGFSVNGERS